MKKIRIVGLLLVLVLITSSFVGGTFAKYTSTATGSDKAVIAKWHIMVDNTDIATEQEFTFDLFKTIQDDPDPVIGGSDDLHVDNAASNVAETPQIIAPGTGGAFNLVVKNLSQVYAEYDLNLAINFENMPQDAQGELTVPLEFKAMCGNEVLTDWTDTISNLNFENRQLAYADHSTEADDETITIFWRWRFEQFEANAEDDVKAEKDGIDTLLGIAAQTAPPATPPTVTVTATVLAEQVD